MAVEQSWPIGMPHGRWTSSSTTSLLRRSGSPPRSRSLARRSCCGADVAHRRMTPKNTVPPDLSVVIPVFNEGENVDPLCHEFTDTLTAWGRPYELIIVDDGSTDDTFERLKQRQIVDRRLRVIRFRRNFGQTAAFSAGFSAARGRLIATSDGDLQNDPPDPPQR